MNITGDRTPKKILVEDMKSKVTYTFNSIKEASLFLKVVPSYVGSISKVSGIINYRYKVSRVEEST